MISQQLLTQHQSLYYAWLLTRRAAGDTVESLASTLVDSQVDLNPHQVEAALFACSNPLSRGVKLFCNHALQSSQAASASRRVTSPGSTFPPP